MSSRLAHKRCLIVGGTSGIGLAAARRFLEEGARVVIAGRSPDKGAEAVASLGALGPMAFVPCDAARTDQVGHLFARATTLLEGLNVLAPGLIDTPMAARAVNDPDIRRFLTTKQPLGPGPGRPEDCGDAAVFLCSDAARFVTGVVLPVDGGWCVSEGQYADVSR